jgi:hypothetical protein
MADRGRQRPLKARFAYSHSTRLLVISVKLHWFGLCQTNAVTPTQLNQSVLDYTGPLHNYTLAKYVNASGSISCHYLDKVASLSISLSIRINSLQDYFFVNLPFFYNGAYLRKSLWNSMLSDIHNLSDCNYKIEVKKYVCKSVYNKVH